MYLSAIVKGLRNGRIPPASLNSLNASYNVFEEAIEAISDGRNIAICLRVWSGVPVHENKILRVSTDTTHFLYQGVHDDYFLACANCDMNVELHLDFGCLNPDPDSGELTQALWRAVRYHLPACSICVESDFLNSPFISKPISRAGGRVIRF